MRVWLGCALISHSVFKIFNPQIMERFCSAVEKLGFPLPYIFGYLAKGSEFFGGILLIIGLFTRTSSVFIFLTMLVAAFMSHEGDIFGEAEMAFTYLIIALYFIFNGSGKYSLERLIESKNEL